MSKIVVACDSFKDALTSDQVCRAICEGLSRGNSRINCIPVPLADGGEGTARILRQLTGGKTATRPSFNPLMRPMNAHYGLSSDGKTAFIDLATCSGLQLLSDADRNPLQTSTYGTGLLIKDAIERQVDKIILGIGGSATNDGGMGMARALGYTFLDESGKELEGRGKDLLLVRSVLPTSITLPKIEVLCDVTNPLYGEKGAAHVYAKQKGATPKGVELLDKGLRNFAEVVREELGRGDAELPGSGAAGGMGFGAMTFLNALPKRGGDTVIRYAKLSTLLKDADLAITGEGTIDKQTLNGKLVQGVAKACAKRKVPVIGLCGQLEADSSLVKDIGLFAAFSIVNGPMSLSTSIARSAELLEEKALYLAKLLFPQ